MSDVELHGLINLERMITVNVVQSKCIESTIRRVVADLKYTCGIILSENEIKIINKFIIKN